MKDRPRATIVLVANNPYGHHLLASQLVNIYQGLKIQADVKLLCNGTMALAQPDPPGAIEVISFATRWGGAFDYLNLLLHLFALRWRHPQAIYHLRGFVAGASFFLSRFLLLRSAKYIYDPRGAFFIEWREAGKPRIISYVQRWVEDRLIRSSRVTVVTSARFARLYRRLFGNEHKYITIYNSTNFPISSDRPALVDGEKVRLVYLGTFNHWHDMDEVVRVMSSAAKQLGPERVEISIFTLPKFHGAARQRFSAIKCSALSIEYVSYDKLPRALADKHVGVSVVRPTLSSCIASPIKVADYIAFGLVPLMNSGIGDFDAYFRRENSAILYKFGEEIEMSRLQVTVTAPNRKIYNQVSSKQARLKLSSIVETLLNG